MRLGIYGGTFDPPHRSHALAVLWALQSGEIDRVVLVPASQHAFGKNPVADVYHRLEMCRILVREFREELVEVSDIEARRPGVSYMIETVRQLKREHNDAPMRLVVGTDLLGDLPRWREGEELIRLASPLVVPRIIEGVKTAECGPRPGALPMLSSTTVREHLSRGLDTGELLSSAVAEYIRQHKLYRE